VKRVLAACFCHKYPVSGLAGDGPYSETD